MKFSKELKAGLIAIFAIISFTILFQFMKGKNIFSTDNQYYIKYDNVEGLAKSNPVSINGLRVGQVSEIKPVPTASGDIHFVVQITVDDKFEFTKNSNVEIFEPGLMSGKELRINLAKGNVLAKDGDTLKGNFQLSMLNSLASQVGPVKDQVSSVLSKLDSTMVSANKLVDEQNRQQIKVLLANLNQTVSAFKVTADQTNRMLANNEAGVKSVVDNANKTLVSTKATVDKFGNVADNVDVKKLNSAIENLSTTADKLNSVIAGIQNGEGSLGKLTKDEDLYNNLNKTSSNLNALIEDLKANPKRYINISVFGKK
ncbi:phospholipid/cholesterol/gamma-HCH transport system substrate-binding protein [Soonwooa buanensis]|uniref:Phospholipid/cholesterol/gamma-HCH transport system substrate-binding protein n=1 Tax=Soonwooa buanensis TaxID=619805 RepID=A0A1T5EEH8_9FLAO|nr:MlaD family protein [Soonwooa buanensis]SKB82392.1 phospholipid/cholesterol/gamma-HCH transport system substrate-binding protein [Soonwooa buanensis]